MNNKFQKFVCLSRNNFELLTLLLLGLFLNWIGLGWVLNIFLILVALIFIALWIWLCKIRRWFQRDLVENECPVCSYRFTEFNKTEGRCPNCGEPLKIEEGHFDRVIPPDTIDIDAVEVSVNQLED